MPRSTIRRRQSRSAGSYYFASSVTGLKPTSLIVIDSTEVDPADLAALEASSTETRAAMLDCLFRTRSLPSFGGAATVVNLGLAANQPTFNNATTHVVTLPAVAGVQWKVNGVNRPLVLSLHSLLVRRQRLTQRRLLVTLSKATPIGRSSASKIIERRPENAINYCSRNRTFRRSYF
jgi:hypothetical protein